MTREEICQKIIVCLEKEKSGGISRESIIPSTNLLLDLGLDSIEIVNFVVSLEEMFEVRFAEPFELIDKFARFEELVEFCEVKLNERRVE